MLIRPERWKQVTRVSLLLVKYTLDKASEAAARAWKLNVSVQQASGKL